MQEDKPYEAQMDYEAHTPCINDDFGEFSSCNGTNKNNSPLTFPNMVSQ